METLKEYADLLHSKDYQELPVPFTFFNGELQEVFFLRPKYNRVVILAVVPIEDSKESEDVDYNDYIVMSASIDCAISDISTFWDASNCGITLVKEPDKDDYYIHGLDLFEKCLDLEGFNLVKHEAFIANRHTQAIDWAAKYLVPVLEELGFSYDYSTYFATDDQRDSSDQWMCFRKGLQYDLLIGTDCITGENTVKLLGTNLNIIGSTDLDYIKKSITDLLEPYETS